MLRAASVARFIRPALAVACLGCLASCNPPAAQRRQLSSPYPPDRARAAVAAAEAGDAKAIDLLIELLDDRDRAVRMYSILALERLCGRTYGYRYYDPEPQRRAAIARWRQARQRGELVLLRRAPGPEPPEAAKVAAP